MKKYFMMAMMALALFACKGNKATNTETEEDAISNNEQASEDAKKLDFALALQDGTQMNVLEEVKKHKVTILDFWASWCGPCCAEMPNMVNIYKKYQEKGLGMIGISLDQDYDEWTTAIGELGITWPSLLDTDGSISDRFGIQYIPYTVVANKKGEILKTNLHGEELEQFVADLLK